MSAVSRNRTLAFAAVTRAALGPAPRCRLFRPFLIGPVVVEDEQVRIRGTRKALKRAVIATMAGTRKGMPSFAREWRTQEDSNLWPLPSEGSALSSELWGRSRSSSGEAPRGQAELLHRLSIGRRPMPGR